MTDQSNRPDVRHGRGCPTQPEPGQPAPEALARLAGLSDEDLQALVEVAGEELRQVGEQADAALAALEAFDRAVRLPARRRELQSELASIEAEQRRRAEPILAEWAEQCQEMIATYVGEDNQALAQIEEAVAGVEHLPERIGQITERRVRREREIEGERQKVAEQTGRYAPGLEAVRWSDLNISQLANRLAHIARLLDPASLARVGF